LGKSAAKDSLVTPASNNNKTSAANHHQSPHVSATLQHLGQQQLGPLPHSQDFIPIHELAGTYNNCGNSVSAKAVSCPISRGQSKISGPWSFEWIKDHHLGDVGLIFSHKSKDKTIVRQQAKKGVSTNKSQLHTPSLVSLRRVARMPLKDRQALLRMFKRYKQKKSS